MSKINYILPFYHAVSDEQLPHLRHLFPVKKIIDFKKDLDFFCSKYQPVSLEEFFNLAKHGFHTLKKPVFHLSFDDGLRQCYDVILPILEAKGIPATFFINSGFIDNKDLFFRFKASFLIDELHKRGIKNRKDQKEILHLNYHQKDSFESLAKKINIDFDAYLKKNKPYLDLRQLEEMKLRGFSIGAHSIDHPEFRFLEMDERIRQLQLSMQFICEKFDSPVKAFSFPFTDHKINQDFFREIKKRELSDISFGTAGIKEDYAKMNYQRIPMETMYSGKLTYFYQLWKAKLRLLACKNTIERHF